MSSFRQTNMSTHSTTNHLTNHDDNNLDLLLEDLQTSVSRPGSSAGHRQVVTTGGPVTTGYREVSRSVTTHGVNGPSNSTEYQIEYLNPSNSTTVVSERSVSPGFDHLLTNTADCPPGTKKIAQYKVQSYQYKTVGGQNYQDGSSGSMKENINELDSLLDDLNSAQKTGFAGNSLVTKKSSGLDSSFIEPLETSTPTKGGHVSRSVEKKVFQEHRYGSVGRQSPARELKHEKVVHESSPHHQRKETYRYETKTTRSGNVRETSPPSPPAIRSSPSPSRHQQQHVRSYNYTSASEHDAPRTPSMRRANSPSHRSPSPAVKPTVKSYNYSSTSNSSSSSSHVQGHPSPAPYRSPSPTSRTNSTARAHAYEQYRAPSPSPKHHTTVHSYNYSSSSTTKDSRQEVPKTPPPHRSPSPVSFPQPPLPSPKNTEGKPYTFPIKPQSPQPVQKFSPSDPSRTLNYQVSPFPNPSPTVITYKYSSHSTQHSTSDDHMNHPRPFPTSPSPTPPEEQRPPKKLDELMASFSDSETHHSSLRHRDVSSRYTHQQPQQPTPPKPPTPPPEPKVTRVNHNNIQKSSNVTGPPVYYPPGVELFSKKEEIMQQSEGGGKMKSKAKASYEYESKSKSKVKESSGKSVVPVCLPVCCAMPCVIM